MKDLLSIIDAANLASLVLLLGVHFFYSPVTGHFLGEDVSSRMKHWRLEWAKQALWRHERITDVSLVRGLMGGVAFFASTSVLLISGLVALLRASEAVAATLSEYPLVSAVQPELVSLKIAALLLLAISAFFKFGWSMRLHSYSSIFVGAMPEPDEKGSEYSIAISARVAEMSFLASKHYHGGIRAYYFGFAALTWFLSPWLFLPTLAVIVAVMVRRDYMSKAFRLAECIPRETG